MTSSHTILSESTILYTIANHPIAACIYTESASKIRDGDWKLCIRLSADQYRPAIFCFQTITITLIAKKFCQQRIESEVDGSRKRARWRQESKECWWDGQGYWTREKIHRSPVSKTGLRFKGVRSLLARVILATFKIIFKFKETWK